MTEKEEWRDIPEFHGWYQISNKGNVRSFRVGATPKELHKKRDGEKSYVRLRGGKQNYYQIEKLMLEIWPDHVSKKEKEIDYDKQCKGCIYRKYMSICMGCNYLFETGKRRARDPETGECLSKRTQRTRRSRK